MLRLQTLLGCFDGNGKPVPNLIERRSLYGIKLKYAANLSLHIFHGCQELPENQAV
jgi:hypothetical protein